MSDIETLKELLRRTALGDEDAIGELAGQIGGAAAQGVTAQGVSDYVKAQIKANAAAERYARNYQDIEADDELRAKARKLDNEMARRHPEMNLDARFSAVGETIRARYGVDADRAEFIAYERARRRQHLADGASLEEENAYEIEHDRSAAIAEMKEARKGRPGPTPEDRQRYVAEQDRRKRIAEG